MHVPSDSAAILQLVPHTFYAGPHPTSILADNTHSGFEIRTRVVLQTFPAAGAGAGAATTTGTLTVSVNGVPAATVSAPVVLAAGISNVTVTIPASATVGVKLWHPHNHGGQARYNVTAVFTPTTSAGATVANSSSSSSSTAWRMLGFRHIALVTINDTNVTAAKDAATQDGTGQQGMFFRVNGAAVYARGGNKIPMDLIDGRMSATAHSRLVQSAAEGNMNMLRVWGGGIWEPRAFFDACDEFGVLLYLDMQFTWGSVDVEGATRPAVRDELRYQIQRISHHPSIAVLDGCNECGGGGLTESFVMPTVRP